MEGQLTFDWPGGKGVRYRALLGATVKGGKVTSTDAGLKVEAADEVTLYVSAGTDMRTKDFTTAIAARLKGALAADFSVLRDAAAADHRELIERCQLSLPVTAASKLPTPERVKLAQTTPDPSLEALYFQFGRHLGRGTRAQMAGYFSVQFAGKRLRDPGPGIQWQGEHHHPDLRGDL